MWNISQRHYDFRNDETWQFLSWMTENHLIDSSISGLIHLEMDSSADIWGVNTGLSAGEWHKHTDISIPLSSRLATEVLFQLMFCNMCIAGNHAISGNGIITHRLMLLHLHFIQEAKDIAQIIFKNCVIQDISQKMLYYNIAKLTS